MKAVIGVPGKWGSKDEILPLILATNEDFICAGSSLINTQTQALFELEVYGYNPDLKISYTYCGRKTFTEQDIRSIDEHTYTVYIIGEAGTPGLAYELLKAGNALLNAGGMAVKVESSGIAHLKQHWQRLMADNDIMALYQAFTTIAKSTQFYLSYGMQVMGYPEGQIFFIGEDGENGEQLKVLDVFLTSVLIDQSILNSECTFSLSKHQIPYQLKHVYYDKYPEDDLFFNPQGIWQLTQVNE